MCFKNDPKAVTRAIAIVALIVVSFVVGTCAGALGAKAKAKTPTQTALTQVDADAALKWLQQKMPNSGMAAARVSETAPWLVSVDSGGDGDVPLMYDPAHHALIIGLVINFDNPNQIIAPGKLNGVDK